MPPHQPLPLQFPSLAARILRRPTPPRQPPLRNPLPSKTRTPKRQPYSSSNTNPPPTPPNPSPSPQKPTTRLHRILTRLPPPLQHYTTRLRSAPTTHVVAFLLLHELTAVVPLAGLFALFHYTEQVPVAWMVAHCGGYVREGVGRFERWFWRRGLFGFGDVGVTEGEGGDVEGEGGGKGDGQGVVGADAVLSRWEADPKYRILVEVGLAYALTKVLLPVRIVASVWATPWFAGVLGRLRRVVRRG
ncbi:hypothetical protein F5144DRAFT_628971 [Chaetomium tenue]|uniref:Uncharacterized protein n=1 Tax=Chaetomium tenue TaxID=1854479 RepID=A0ACB7PFC3_9PEZI|nr:hypothetical protein F5144DRAFT_628971 [Chaetomium globosum]